MTGAPLKARIETYGISPWEIEVAHGCLNGRFEVIHEELSEPEPDYISYMRIAIPLDFSEAFFEWLGFKRWENIKILFKEMKKRRGSKNSLKIRLDYAGYPAISFTIDPPERRLYDNAVEKLDFVTELLQYHIKTIPDNTHSLTYRYDINTRRWVFDMAKTQDTTLRYDGKEWKNSDL